MKKIRFNQSVSILAVIVGAGFLGACGGGSSGSDAGAGGPGQSILTGVFMDAPVDGLAYVSSPSGYSGTTSGGGQFRYLPMDTVTFKLNGMGIGTGTAATVMTPLDLVTDPLQEADTTAQKNNKVIKILQLLQTLDTDKNPSNGITLKNDGSLAQKTLATLDLASATDLATLGVSAADVITQQNAAAHFLGQLDAVNKSGTAFYFTRLLKRQALSVNGVTADSMLASRWAARQASVITAIQKNLDKFTVSSTDSTKHGVLPGIVVKLTLPDGTPKTFVSGYYDMGSDTTRITGDEKSMVDTKVFRIGSITKTFTGMTVLQLVQEGKVDLTAPLSTYLSNLDPNSLLTGATVGLADVNTITVTQLLTHMGGIQQTSSQKMTDLKGAFDFNSWGLQGYLNSGLDNKYSSLGVPVRTNWTAQNLIDISWGLGLVKPGTAWHYSNINYVLLGMIIEKVTGNPWYTEVANRFGPASTFGLTIDYSTVVPPTLPGGADKGATGYIDWYDNFSGACQTYPNCTLNTKYAVAIHPGYYGASGGLTGSVHDLYAWATAIGNTYEGKTSGALLSSTFGASSGGYKGLTDIFELVPNVLHMGLGIFANVARRTVGHPGQVQGYDCSSWYRYDVQQPVAACANTSIAGGGKVMDLAVNPVLDLMDGKTEIN
ncbi:MAG: beta-lactamase family protein [Magnetococcales bacterium]|nr:beta-lactamase family protein [Magnetococcales bacterium]